VDLQELSQAVQSGNAKRTKELVAQALEEDVQPDVILNDALVMAMTEVGAKFAANEIFVPEMLIAARAMNAGLQVLEPVLANKGVKPLGKCIIGAVKGDLHDIGKNLVTMMLKGVGVDVVDLGVDVSPETFLAKAEEEKADIVALAALLTTTMPAMGETIDTFAAAGMRNKYVFMVGGAPVTAGFAKQIGADFYCENGAVAAESAQKVLLKKAN
jgi:5-methyltetrahydrofolate--homocysteine methyltransferase